MEQLFLVLSLVILSGLSLLTLGYVVRSESQQVPEKVKVREKRDE